MRKILFLTKSYPDFRKSATVLCTHRVMEACAQNSDFEVHCLCLQYPGEEREELVNGIHVSRIPQTFFEKIKYKYSIDTSSKGKRCFHFFDRLQKTCTIPLYPCITPLQLYKWERYAKQISGDNQYDAVIAEHYGYNTLQVGLYLKKHFPSIKYVPLLWDPIDGQVITTKLPTTFTTKRIHQIENEVGSTADMIISTVAMKAYYETHGDAYENKRKYLDIPSVIPPEGEVVTPHLELLDKDCINIVFSGYIDSHRDINPVFEALNNCTQASRMNVVFFSKGVCAKDISYWEKNFKGSVIFHDYIPLSELHTIYRHADYLLNISSINPNLIPSKIFEYMSFGKPIISTYQSDGDSAKRYLDKYPEACVLDLKKSLSCNCGDLESFILEKHAEVSFDIVNKLFGDNTPKAYVRTIFEIF